MSFLRTIPSEPTRSRPLRAEAAEGIAESEHLRGGVVLPPGHPAWPRDLVSLTRRARALLATLPRLVVRVWSAWDHARREAIVNGYTVVIDGAGTYRAL